MTLVSPKELENLVQEAGREYASEFLAELSQEMIDATVLGENTCSIFIFVFEKEITKWGRNIWKKNSKFTRHFRETVVECQYQEFPHSELLPWQKLVVEEIVLRGYRLYVQLDGLFVKVRVAF